MWNKGVLHLRDKHTAFEREQAKIIQLLSSEFS